ncbi:integrating conjugative element protein, PFL_4709 family [Actinobacillus pleuropneumoniae]|nr:hypothetical protein ACEE_04920 [Actinobacillus equuli subsp. equuli]EFL80055.1 hypothetical protein APP6_0536 [Actinobacillus pleuropneumoniae serovar 6 str. Femo]SNV30842.1 integrating conjugative element protein, PFL_4709 family [Actinobacillus suis]SUU63365.1 integrating conjugative element protein, PFL_4709 family [Actinobacillus pleuropneumoniae]VEE89317.1 integrating conjugative element protein, PFL_4709 family [Actinobacillus equuli]
MNKRYNFYSYLALLIGSGISPLSMANIEPIISVYTTSSYHLTHQELATQVYYLDKVTNIENVISQGLSHDPVMAEQQAKALFNSPQWAEKEALIKDAYTDVISAWQNGIKKVPAVLFQNSTGETSVIYGETNIAKAKKLWEQWFQNRKEGQ